MADRNASSTAAGLDPAKLAHMLAAATYAMGGVLVAAIIMRAGWGSPQTAWFVGVGVVLIGVQIHMAVASRQAHRALLDDVLRARRSTARVAENLAKTRSALEALEGRVEVDGDKRTQALMEELRELEALVRRVSAREIAEAQDLIPPPPERARGVRQGPPQTDGERRSAEALLKSVRWAVETGQVEIHLQPIVTLPQRKVVAYEAFTRLRDEDGQVIMPAEWLRVAEPAGLVGAVDNLLLFRSLQIAQRMLERDAKLSLFCNIGLASLSDERFFPDFLGYVRETPDLARALVFELGQADYLRRGSMAARNMGRLADHGFRFSIDKLTSFDLDLAELERAGVTTVKAAGDRLMHALHDGRELGVPDAPMARAGDYVRVLAERGIELIADKVEHESTVVEILDLDVAFAQGHLFGAPKLARVDEGQAQPRPAARDLPRRAYG